MGAFECRQAEEIRNAFAAISYDVLYIQAKPSCCSAEKEHAETVTDVEAEPRLPHIRKSSGEANACGLHGEPRGVVHRRELSWPKHVNDGQQRMRATHESEDASAE